MARFTVPDLSWTEGRPSLEAVVDYMVKFAHDGMTDTVVINKVKEICSGLMSGDYASEAYALYAWVHKHVRYMRDPLGVEMVQTPRVTMETGSGDCDDMSTLLASMLMIAGNKVRFALVGFDPGGPPSHVFCEVLNHKRWVTLDPVANKESGVMLGRVTTSERVRL